MKSVPLGAIVVAAMVLGSSGATATEIRGKGDKCIDIPDGDTKPGTKVHYWPCDGSPEQQWTLQGGRIQGKDGMWLDVPDGDTRDGTRLHIGRCDGSPEQRWQFANGEIRIGGKCVDLPNGATRDGTPIQLWPCDGGPEQKWRYQGVSVAAPPNAANVLGRVMGLFIYIERCRIPATSAQVAELNTAGARLQRVVGIPDNQMAALNADLEKSATASGDSMLTGFAQSYRETIALVASVP